MGFRFPAFWWRAPSWLSFGWVSQLCAFLWEGCQNSFNCSLLSNHVEVNILLTCKCLFPFFIFSIRLLDSFCLKQSYWNIVISGQSFFFFFFFFVIPVSGMWLSRILSLLNWVCWVRGNSFGEPGHVYSLCAYFSAVWSGGPVQFYLIAVVGWAAGLYRFFSFSASVVAGTVRLKWWGGVVRFFFAFFSLLSAFLAVGSLR